MRQRGRERQPIAEGDILYGMNPVLEALRANRRRVKEIFIAEGRKETALARVAEEARRRAVPVRTAIRDDISRRAGTEKHQGIVACVDAYPYAVLETLAEAALADPRKALLLMLDGVTDPQNLGSLVRTAHLLGVHGVILPRDNAAGVTAAAVKASAGATEYLPIAQVTNLVRTVQYLKELGMWVAGAEASGDKSLYDHDFAGHHVVLVMGSEGAGIRRLLKENCDHLLSIPMEGHITSYNVSAAGALLLGEIARQRRRWEEARTVPKSPQKP